MKKIVLTFGLISGAIVSAMMALNIAFQDQIGFDRGEIIGYTSMVVAFLLIYFGVRSYRDNVAGGSVTFGRAFKVGALIAVVASVCYVGTWQVIYFGFKTDFMEKYQAHLIEQARAGGETEAELEKRRADMDRFAKLYRNPVINAGVTLLEPLPVALVITLVTAGVLSRQKRSDSAAMNAGARVMT